MIKKMDEVTVRRVANLFNKLTDRVLHIFILSLVSKRRQVVMK